ncbi:metal transporter [Mycobacterium sp. URHB0044]|uniref:metal transporter n=1 Tax=Mycobacterium sp. URHB0044 TaxID=1380386 RepID=UPI000AAA8569|nr:metal transporter [Mycobacterium sp. URHB0044]
MFGVKAAATVATTSVNLATAPIRQTTIVPSAVQTAVRVAFENVGGSQVRRCYSSHDRAWIEVCGLRDTPGSELGDAVLAAVSRHPGVTSAHLNYPLSRVLVRFGDEGPTCAQLCESVDAAEASARARGGGASSSRSPNLPGDDGVLAARLVSAGITAAGLWGAAVGRTLGLPRLPLVVGASVSVAKYQPRLRGMLEDQFGKAGASRTLDAATFVSRTVGQVPGALAVGLASRLARAAETRATQCAWEHYEPLLADFAECSDVCPLPEQLNARGPVERQVDRSALAQAIGAAAAGMLSGNPDVAARAALVAIPKAAYSTREFFATTLGRGLADDRAALTLRPDIWRKLDRIDAVVIDPRVSSQGIVVEAARSGAAVVPVDGDGLDDASLDETLADTVASLHDSGRSAAVVTTAAAQACAAADVAVGLIGTDCPVPWYADVLVDDPAAVWRILHALRLARAASQYGVAISTVASALGALATMIPAVPGQGHGPGPVTVGAALGQWTGYRLAREALHATPPFDDSAQISS